MPLFSCIPLGCRGGVDVIDRTQCSLEELPPEVDRSAHTLEELYLDCNQISEISEKLARCRKLRTLSLAQNKLLRIPTFIGCLKALEELHLEDNELTDLPFELQDCTNLQILDLRLNLFLRLPDVVTHLESLTQLHLFETSLTQLPSDIGYLQNLRYLDVRENQLRVLPPSICDLKNLKQLDVGRNELLLLPMGLGVLENLEELYADHNLLNAVPDSIVNCRLLKALDISENDVLSLPEELGELTELCELNISENRITSLPSSLSRLKKLNVLKADSNGIAILTTAIGGCSALRELYLANNQLTSIPSAVGNLGQLTLLTLDENRLTEIPSTIGGCKKLSILTLRNNQLKELPLEIGRLDSLNVLDVCDNKLMFLPYTASVLTNLRALWLSIDQSVPRVPWAVALDPVTHVKVLTCYLLPQGVGQEMIARQRRTDGNVHFGEDGEAGIEEEPEHTGFIRRGTPHPKPRSRIGLRRQSIDGHLIPHNKEEKKNDQTLSLRRKSMGDTPNPAVGSTQALPEQHSTDSALEMFHEKKLADQEDNHLALGSTEAVNFSDTKKLKIHIKRNAGTGFGLTMAGGCDSEPYKKGDNGLFISKVIEGEAAESAGLHVGDKILSVNGTSVVNEYHGTAVELMQKGDALDLVVLRDEGTSNLSTLHSIQETVKQTEDGRNSASFDTISTTVQRDLDGSLGFEVTFGTKPGMEKNLLVCCVKNDSLKLHVGDCILSINGENILNMDLVDARKKFEEDGGRELYLVVRRENAVEASISLAPTVEGVDEVSPLHELVAPKASLGLRGEDTVGKQLPEADAELVLNAGLFNGSQQTDENGKVAMDNKEKEVTATVKKAPPVAPKPKGFKLFSSACASVEELPSDDVLNAAEPFKLAFSSKIKKFESVGQMPANQSTENSGRPAKKPLVSQEDILKMKEEEQKKMIHLSESLLSDSEDEFKEAAFDEFMEVRTAVQKAPTVVRTKKAEIRMERSSSINSESFEYEKSFDDLEKRQKWRQARYKSLEIASAKAECVMEQVREISSRLGVVAEESSNTGLSTNGCLVNNNIGNSFSKPVIDCGERLLNGATASVATLGVS